MWRSFSYLLSYSCLKARRASKFTHTCTVHTYANSIFRYRPKHRRPKIVILFTMRRDPTALRHLLQFVFVCSRNNLIKNLKGGKLCFSFPSSKYLSINTFLHLLHSSHASNTKEYSVVKNLLNLKLLSFVGIFREVPWITDHL